MRHPHQRPLDDISLPLISNAGVIEYLAPIMSKDLLSMFPHNSPSLDHAQSSIWSPLVPRNYASSLDTYGENSGGRDGVRKMMKRCWGVDKRSVSAKRKTKKRRSISDAAEAAEGGCRCIPFTGKGWTKMMRAASRQFKKKKEKMMMGRKNSTVIRVKLTNSIVEGTSRAKGIEFRKHQV